jgi:hypothetical protein
VVDQLPGAEGALATAVARIVLASSALIAFGITGERRSLGISADRPYFSALATHR